MTFTLFEDETIEEVGNSSTNVALEPAAVTLPTPVVAVAAPEPLGFVEALVIYYQARLDKAIAAAEVIDAIVDKSDTHEFDPFDEVRRKAPSANTLKKEMFKAIIAGAKRTGLAVPGNYSFDDEVFEEYISGLHSYDGDNPKLRVQVDIPGLCKAIYATYGGDAGENIAKKRVAYDLIRTFQLHNHTIEVKSGFVGLHHHVYLERRFSGGGYEVSYASQNTIRNTLRDLKLLFENSNMHFEMSELDQIFDYRSRFDPIPNRTKLFGKVDDKPVTVKFFKDKLQWLFTEDVIAVISDFVSEYGDTE